MVFQQSFARETVLYKLIKTVIFYSESPALTRYFARTFCRYRGSMAKSKLRLCKSKPSKPEPPASGRSRIMGTGTCLERFYLLVLDSLGGID